MRRCSILLALMLGLLGSSASPAHAQELDFDLAITGATLLDPAHVRIEGTIACSFEAFGEDVVIRSLRQRGGPLGFREGFGLMPTFLCDPTPLPLDLIVEGGPFHPGPALFEAEVELSGEAEGLFERISGTVHIRKAKTPQVQPTGIDLDVVSATLLDPGHVQVEATVTCEAADQAFVDVELRQRGGIMGFRSGSGFIPQAISCVPTPTPISLVVTGGPFHPGHALFDAFVEPDTLSQRVQILGTVRIRP